MNLIKTDHLLVGGHSWTTGKDWFNEIYDHQRITNLSYPGAGNKYIADSVMEYLVNDRSVTQVLVCWSGLVRIDIPLPKKVRPEWHDIETKGQTTHSTYYSNERAPWRDRNAKLRIENDLLRLMYQEVDYRSVKNQSLVSMINLQNFLKVNGVEYRFCFMYDYTNEDFDHSHLKKESDFDGFSTLGIVGKDNTMLNQLDRNFVLEPAGIDWALKQDEDIFKDAIHLTNEGYRKWAKELLKSHK